MSDLSKLAAEIDASPDRVDPVNVPAAFEAWRISKGLPSAEASYAVRWALEGWQAASARSEARWRPIDEAPKDGTDVLVCFDSATVLIAHIAWWRNFGDAPDMEPDEVGWWSYVRGSVGQEMVEPSHWMPLPAAPATGDKT